MKIHTLVFKCIGSNNSQAVLRSTSQKLENGDTVRLTLNPEPRNPEDARYSQIDNEWHRIGYVVQECLNAVHAALSNNFSWAKYVVHWSICSWMVCWDQSGKERLLAVVCSTCNVHVYYCY